MKCSRGKARKNGGAKGCGKAAEWKSQKTTFPLRLEIPQTPAGFPLSHSLGDCGTLTTNRTFHLLRKGDTSNVVSRGTFLMSVDTGNPIKLTTWRGGSILSIQTWRGLFRAHRFDRFFPIIGVSKIPGYSERNGEMP